MKIIFFLLACFCTALVIADETPTYPAGKLLTVTVGGEGWKQLLRRFEEAALPDRKQSVRATEMAADLVMTTGIEFSEEKEEVKFRIGTLKELCGLTNPISPKDLLDPAFLAKYELELCKQSDAPFIRLSYLDQPKGDILLVGMPPGKISTDPDPTIFQLGSTEHGPRLRTTGVSPTHLLGPERQIVFRERKK